jgi:hypothetical protein
MPGYNLSRAHFITFPPKIVRLLAKRVPATGFIVILVLLSILAPTRLEAGSLDVLPAAAQRGTEGLRVTVGSSCASPQDQTVDNQTLNGPTTIEGCQSVTSSSTTVASGEITFRAGQEITLGDGFSVESGATFVAQVDGTLLPDAYLEDSTVGARPHYAAGFFVDVTSLALGDSDRFDLFTGESSGGVRCGSPLYSIAMQVSVKTA